MIHLNDINNVPSHYHTVIDRTLIEDWNSFLSALYKDLLLIIKEIEADRASAIKDEDNITDSIRRGLRLLNWIATHDTMEGGHVDLTVELANYKWKAEAKLNDGAKYLCDAFEQIDVYTMAKDKETGFLIYNFNKNMKLSIERFEEMASNLSDREIIFEKFGEDTFTNKSQFKHSSGFFINIKYFWINLYHHQRTSKKNIV